MGILEVKGVNKRFGGLQALGDVNLSVQEKSVHAIIGPNGAGKTTYFNLMSGQLVATSGTVLLNGENITRMSVPERTDKGIGRAFQLTNLFPTLTVRENVRLVAQAKARQGFDLLSIAESHIELTKKELEVLGLLVIGMTNKEVARQLNNSERTINVHRSNMMRKLGLINIAELVNFAYNNGLIRH